MKTTQTGVNFTFVRYIAIRSKGFNGPADTLELYTDDANGEFILIQGGRVVKDERLLALVRAGRV